MKLNEVKKNKNYIIKDVINPFCYRLIEMGIFKGKMVQKQTDGVYRIGDFKICLDKEFCKCILVEEII